MVHEVAKSQTGLNDFTFPFHFHALEKAMATHSSVLAWRIPGTGEPGGLPSMGSHRVGHDWSDLAAATGSSVVKHLPASAGDSGDKGWIPGLGISLRGGNGNPLQCSCVGNPMDRGARWATVHVVAKSQTWQHTQWQQTVAFNEGGDKIEKYEDYFTAFQNLNRIRKYNVGIESIIHYLINIYWVSVIYQIMGLQI